MRKLKLTWRKFEFLLLWVGEWSVGTPLARISATETWEAPNPVLKPYSISWNTLYIQTIQYVHMYLFNQGNKHPVYPSNSICTYVPYFILPLIHKKLNLVRCRTRNMFGLVGEIPPQGRQPTLITIARHITIGFPL